MNGKVLYVLGLSIPDRFKRVGGVVPPQDLVKNPTPDFSAETERLFFKGFH